MTVGERIKFRREEIGMSQDELANRMGYKSRSAITKVEKSQRDINQSKIVEYATALNTTPAYLMGWEEEKITSSDAEDLYQKYPNIKPIHLKKFPMLGEIACGNPIFADEDKENYIMADMDINADFCLTAKGDSMINARINDGDIVFIKEMPIVSNGEIAAIIIDDDATLKRFYYYPKDNKLMLVADNPAYEPIVLLGEELDHIRCLGKAVYFMSAL